MLMCWKITYSLIKMDVMLVSLYPKDISGPQLLNLPSAKQQLQPVKGNEDVKDWNVQALTGIDLDFFFLQINELT